MKRIIHCRHPVIPTTLALLFAACGTGGMGQIAVSRDCGATRNCDRTTLDAPIAVGARLTPALFAGVQGSAMPTLALSSAASEIVVVDNGSLVGVAPGAAAILFSTPAGVVIDFLHMWVATPTRLDLRVELADHTPLGSAAPEIDLVIGEEVRLTAGVFSDAQRLGGDFDLQITSSTQSVSVLRDVTPARRRLIARAPGTAVITARALGLETTLTITVQP